MTTDDSPDFHLYDDDVAAEQHTLSDREQAAWNAEQELASAWAAENRARAGYRARMEDTAQAIANARASKLSWQAIADEMGIHLTNAIRRLRTRDNPADGHPVSEPGPDLNEALAHEHRARRRIDQAMDNTAAAIALARQTGATWATISTTLGGLARRTLLVRLADWAEAPSLAVPDDAQPDGPVPRLSPALRAQMAGTAAEHWWSTAVVSSAVRRGVRAAVGNARTQALLAGAPPAVVLGVARATGRAATIAAVSALLTLAHQDPRASTAHAADVADVAASTARGDLSVTATS